MYMYILYNVYQFLVSSFHANVPSKPLQKLNVIIRGLGLLSPPFCTSFQCPRKRRSEWHRESTLADPTNGCSPRGTPVPGCPKYTGIHWPKYLHHPATIPSFVIGVHEQRTSHSFHSFLGSWTPRAVHELGPESSFHGPDGCFGE